MIWGPFLGALFNVFGVPMEPFYPGTKGPKVYQVNYSLLVYCPLLYLNRLFHFYMVTSSEISLHISETISDWFLKLYSNRFRITIFYPNRA